MESGKPIDAINLAYAFELTEQFEPVQLLKAYLRDVKKVSHAKNAKISPGAQVNCSHFSFKFVMFYVVEFKTARSITKLYIISLEFL